MKQLRIPVGIVVLLLAFANHNLAAAQPDAIDIGSRLELFVDHYLIDSMDYTRLELHRPRPAETVIEFDKPWERLFCGYVTIIKDEDLYRLYYRGMRHAGADGSDVEVTCYAESKDGITFTKPNLGIYEVMGTTENNVVLANDVPFSHNFSPFKDTRPGVAAAERYKAIAGSGKTGLNLFVSEDGLHWTRRDGPIITDGAFDSQNIAFWSEHEQQYLCYFRIFANGVRAISRSTSPDAVTWSACVDMTFGDTPPEHLYTNQTAPYFRAPHIYVAVAARFMPGRRVVSKERMEAMGGNTDYSGDCSDAVLLTSRGGSRYDRTFMEAFIRPGLGMNNWTSRTNYPAYGIVQTGPDEMSMYVQRNYGQESHHLQRLVMRLDGFASINAPYAGGEALTKAIQFSGDKLVINYATSAAGSIWIEIQASDGKPIPGFAQADCDEIIGDMTARTVTWKGQDDVSGLAGQPVRLRFVMKDADLYSIQFQDGA